MTMSCRLVAGRPPAGTPPRPVPDHAVRVRMPRGAARAAPPPMAPPAKLLALHVAETSARPAPPGAWRRVLWWAVIIPGAWVLAAGLGIAAARLLELAR